MARVRRPQNGDQLTTEPARAWTTADLLSALRRRYSAPDHALIVEVPDATGYGKQRTADAVAMSLWPSRGLEVFGFELKASRSDWMRERDDGSKAERIARYCDRWWLVVADEAIVKAGELPPTWGMLAPAPARAGTDPALRIVVEAPKLSPEPIDRSFLAALFRTLNKAESVPRHEHEAAVAKAREEARETEFLHYRSAVERAEEAAQRLRDDIAGFEKASGIRISDGWTRGEEVGAALKLLLSGGALQRLGILRGIQRNVENMQHELARQIAALEAIEDEREPT